MDAKIKHTYNGVDISIDGKRILIQGESGFRKRLSDEELVYFFDAMDRYNQDLGRKPVPKIDNTFVNTSESFETCGKFTRYVPNDVYEKYIKKGIFRFGTLKYFQNMENEIAKDEMEGFCNIFLTINNEYSACSALTGYNYLILCGTDDTNSQYHLDTFGKCKITIPNIDSFCQAVQKAIRAEDYQIKKVRYDDRKLFRTMAININNADELKIGNAKRYKLIMQQAALPSLFIKPTGFNVEKELRIAFEMPKDQKKSLQITNIGLLDYLKIETY